MTSQIQNSMTWQYKFPWLFFTHESSHLSWKFDCYNVTYYYTFFYYKQTRLVNTTNLAIKYSIKYVFPVICFPRLSMTFIIIRWISRPGIPIIKFHDFPGFQGLLWTITRSYAWFWFLSQIDFASYWQSSNKTVNTRVWHWHTFAFSPRTLFLWHTCWCVTEIMSSVIRQLFCILIIKLHKINNGVCLMMNVSYKFLILISEMAPFNSATNSEITYSAS